MGLNCGCPAAAHIADLSINDCKESMGQLQKVAFQRIFQTAGIKNSFNGDSEGSIKLKASWTAKTSAADGTKITISPYIQSPATEAGAARTFGGGNQTLGGIPITIGREPTNFTGIIYQENQAVIAQLKQYQCEEIGVYLIDENGNISCTADNMTKPTKYMPIPIYSFFVGDKSLGGYEEPDSNAISWSFVPNWSDNFYIVKREDLDFNPLTDLVNSASA